MSISTRGVTVGELMSMLDDARLETMDVLYVNQVGNLMVMRDKKYIGFIDHDGVDVMTGDGWIIDSIETD